MKNKTRLKKNFEKFFQVMFQNENVFTGFNYPNLCIYPNYMGLLIYKGCMGVNE